MPITPVVNGDSIVAANIAAMHTSVRSVLNAMTNSELGRFTFNEDQAADIGEGCGTHSTMTTSNVVDDIATTDIEAANFADMTKLIEYSPGVTLSPCYVLLWAWWDTTEWDNEVSKEAARHAGVFGLSVSIDGGADAFPTDNTDRGICRSRVRSLEDPSSAVGSLANGDWATVAHTPNSIVSLYAGTVTPFTLSKITLRGALCLCGSTILIGTLGPTYFKVPRAQVGYLAIRSQ